MSTSNIESAYFDVAQGVEGSPVIRQRVYPCSDCQVIGREIRGSRSPIRGISSPGYAVRFSPNEGVTCPNFDRGFYTSPGFKRGRAEFKCRLLDALRSCPEKELEDPRGIKDFLALSEAREQVMKEPLSVALDTCRLRRLIPFLRQVGFLSSDDVLSKCPELVSYAMAGNLGETLFVVDGHKLIIGEEKWFNWVNLKNPKLPVQETPRMQQIREIVCMETWRKD